METIRFLGLTQENFSANLLPKSVEVLKVFFFKTRVQKVSRNEAMNKVAEELIEIWGHTTKPFHQKSDIVKKINHLIEKYKCLMKGCNKNAESQRAKENDFLQNVYEIFDITNYKRLNENAVNYDDNNVEENYVPTDRK